MKEYQPGFAAALPVEKIIEKDEEITVLEVVGTDDETIEELRKMIEEETGIPIETINENNLGNSSRFYFSSSIWNSPWEPTGPKPNWIKPPENPSLN